MLETLANSICPADRLWSAVYAIEEAWCAWRYWFHVVHGWLWNTSTMWNRCLRADRRHTILQRRQGNASNVMLGQVLNSPRQWSLALTIDDALRPLPSRLLHVCVLLLGHAYENTPETHSGLSI